MQRYILYFFIIFFLNISNLEALKQNDISNEDTPPEYLQDKNENKITYKEFYIDKKSGYISNIGDKNSSTKISLPIFNYYTGENSCYMACVTQDSSKSNISFLNQNIVGVIKVKGEYDGDYCKAYGIEDSQNINDVKELRDLCKACFVNNCDDDNCNISNKTLMFFINF